jgi:hypothetical protein
MKFVILNTDYPDFLQWLYSQQPELEKRSYDEQMRVRNETLFGGADFYSYNLNQLGHEAYYIRANNEFMQKAWAREHGLRVSRDRRWKLRLRKRIVPWLSPVKERRWFYEILAAQIEHYRPDVLLNGAMDGISSRFLREIKPSVRLLAGMHAATRLADTDEWRCYDLVFSSFPPTLDWFRQRGLPAELIRLGFEHRVLSHIETEAATNYDITFVGSFHNVHSSRLALFESLCARFPQIRIWGPKIDHIPAHSLIHNSYVGFAWGREMYQILQNSKLTLNHHGDIGPYANNLRIYEGTGLGALLITDWKENLGEMFQVDKEVVTYRNAEECADRIQYYLSHNAEREAIARAGQQRTLREHTYFHRAQELAEVVRTYL